ncbi:MAG: DUF2254 domain-containing protein, partial [Candidatus Hydrogenedentes bacterium]|nr:DUF2254 domain-containing protein [Candidatus Hydrogenedentota bacterium]
VIFSITIVALTLASSQYGSRLLRGVMRDRVNQVVLGTYIATFVFCLLALLAVRGPEHENFVPNISVSVALLLTLASLLMLIYFIHHVSVSIQAERVIAAVCAECDEVIEALFPQRIDEASAEDQDHDEHRMSEPGPDTTSGVCADSSGYIQAIDFDGAMKIAAENSLTLRFRRRPGEFIMAGSVLVEFWPMVARASDLSSPINKIFLIGRQRSPLQDVEFTIDQLVEIATRALSPGINDPFTAMACIDQLGARLAVLAQRVFPRRSRLDEKGKLRLLVDTVTFAGAADAAFNQIRQHSRGNVAVSARLLETIRHVADQAPRAADRSVLLQHAEMIHGASKEAIPEARDRQDIEERFQRVVKAVRQEST